MSLTSGVRLGPYEIVAPLGAGGMGEVYKARDPRLGRDVAIKVLPASLSADPERLHRFEQEARAAAALNHPNILAVHDIGQHDGAPYIVSELLEGETLRERLNGGALPVRKAVEYAVQIAHGLAAAHEKGITHRDLKPENVFVTSDGRVKILDFGLAKLTQPDAALAGASTSALPTTPPNTEAGMVLGTVGYMAPEQVRGLPADHRSDIFAFGAIVYEILSGQRAFRGETTADTMSAILMKEPPDLPVVERHIPPVLERIVDRCVEKSPASRFQSAVDLAFALDALSSGSSATSAPLAAPARVARERSAWVLFGVAGVIVLALAAGVYQRDAPARDTNPFQFLVSVPPMPNPLDIAISPDGRTITFVASTTEGRTALFVRQSASLALQQLAGTDGATQPFWSPDSRFIGFVTGGILKKVDASGGLPQNVRNLSLSYFSGGTWNSEGTIVVSAGSRLYRVSATGGEPVAVTVLSETQQETGHLWPYFLPDGRHFLYLAWSIQPSNRAVYVGSLDSMERKRLLTVESMAAYAQPGHLLFHRGGTLFAQAFNPSKLEMTGEPVHVADQIFTGSGVGGRSAFAVSQNGALVYRAAGPAANRRFGWFDRTGRQLNSAGEAGLYTTNFDLSPDGKHIAVARLNPAASQYDIWLIDWARDALTRFTFDPAVSFNGNVVWSPDGLRIAFTSDRKGNRDVFARRTDGAGEETLLDSSDDEWIEDWSKDGRYVAYGMNPRAGEAGDIYVLPLFGDRKPIPVVQSPSNDDEPRFSFDGNWLAYNSDESGTHQVYLIPFPPSDQKLQVSSNGGAQPRWRSDGKELYYLDLEGKLMAVNITTDRKLESGTPHVLFDTKLSVDPARDQFAVTPDGQRFLVQLPVAESEPTPITVIVNWPAGLTN